MLIELVSTEITKVKELADLLDDHHFLVEATQVYPNTDLYNLLIKKAKDKADISLSLFSNRKKKPCCLDIRFLVNISLLQQIDLQLHPLEKYRYLHHIGLNQPKRIQLAGYHELNLTYGKENIQVVLFLIEVTAPEEEARTPFQFPTLQHLKGFDNSNQQLVISQWCESGNKIRQLAKQPLPTPGQLAEFCPSMQRYLETVTPLATPHCFFRVLNGYRQLKAIGQALANQTDMKEHQKSIQRLIGQALEHLRLMLNPLAHEQLLKNCREEYFAANNKPSNHDHLWTLVRKAIKGLQQNGYPYKLDDLKRYLNAWMGRQLCFNYELSADCAEKAQWLKHLLLDNHGLEYLFFLEQVALVFEEIEAKRHMQPERLQPGQADALAWHKQQLPASLNVTRVRAVISKMLEDNELDVNGRRKKSRLLYIYALLERWKNLNPCLKVIPDADGKDPTRSLACFLAWLHAKDLIPPMHFDPRTEKFHKKRAKEFFEGKEIPDGDNIGDMLHIFWLKYNTGAGVFTAG